MNSFPCFRITVPLLAALAAGVPSVSSQTALSTGHVDIGLAYEEGAWDLHVHDETLDEEFSPPSGPSGALLVVGAGAGTVVPPDPNYSFLGATGNSIWILPASENPELLFLGLGAEELDAGDWLGNIQVSLSSLTGPGDFFVWSTDPFGVPQVLIDSANGITPADSITVDPGAHAHFNWGFSAPGDYTVFLDATGTHVTDGLVSSGPVGYAFSVVPEPGTWALMGLAGLGWLVRAGLKKSRT